MDWKKPPFGAPGASSLIACGRLLDSEKIGESLKTSTKPTPDGALRERVKKAQGRFPGLFPFTPESSREISLPTKVVQRGTMKELLGHHEPQLLHIRRYRRNRHCHLQRFPRLARAQNE